MTPDHWANEETRQAFEALSRQSDGDRRSESMERILGASKDVTDISRWLRRYITGLINAGEKLDVQFEGLKDWIEQVGDWTAIDWDQLAERIWLARATPMNAPNWSVH